MECKFCKQEVPEGANVCPACGTPVDSENVNSQGTEQAFQGQEQYGTPEQAQSQYGITSQGFQSQDQQGQFQYGASGQGQQGQYQYGASGQGQQGQYQYGASGQSQQGQYQYGSQGQEFQDQYQNGPADQNFQNQYGPSNQGFQGQYQDGSQGQDFQGQYQYGAPDIAGYSYGKTEGNNYGQPVKPISGTPYMIFAIITTLFCCLPLGIAAIVFACRINPLQKAGDYAGAQEEAKKAKLATIIGMVVGAIVSAVYICLAVIGMREYTASDSVSSAEDSRLTDAVEMPAETEDTEEDDNADIDEEEETDDTDEKRPVNQPAEASSELGATWDTFTVQVNDKVLTLPCSMGDLEAAGLTLDTEDTPENYVVNAREYVYSYFKDANDNEILVDIVNLTDEPKSLGECIIGGITVYDSDLVNGGLTVIFPGGIQIGTPKEEVIAKYGETEDAFEDDEDYSSYTWYADSFYYSYCEIDVDAETGLVCNMYMENYGE